jgi:hypothetical protein
MKYCCLLLVICLTTNILCSQDVSIPVLEREITLNIKNQSLEVILETISHQANFVFSYNPEDIKSGDSCSISIIKKPVRQALNILFKDGSVVYKERGKYVILKRNRYYSGSGDYLNREQIIEGYITDSRSGNRLTGVSIYNKDLLVSTITDSYGYFRLSLPPDQIRSGLLISKYGYSDTLLTPLSAKANYVNIGLSYAEDNVKGLTAGNTIKPLEDRSSNSFKSPQWLISNKLIMNARNIKDTIFRNIQLSLFPSASTNKLLTGNAVNNVSINLTVGYVQGVRIAELGSIINIVRDNAKVCQLAGAGNIVGGKFSGFQGAGAYNIVGSIKGVQAGGALNIVKGDAGFCQLAGAGNITGGSFQGVQVAGVANISEDINGAQIAGVLNKAREVSGAQISGVINTATYIKGFQLSVFNYADSCDGVPIGLISLVRKGYHKIELSADELFYSNIAFRTGVKRFHTILMGSIRPDNFKDPLWSYGYGFGTSIGNNQKLIYDIDLTMQQIIKGHYNAFDNLLFKLNLGIDRKITSQISIAAGITYNFFVSDTKTPGYNENYASITPYYFSNTTSNNGLNIKTWLGGKIAVRIF